MAWPIGLTEGTSNLIAHLTGKVMIKHPGLVVVEVGGVGYEVNIPLSTFYDLGEVGSAVSLTIHTHVREDAIQLFGFRTALEKELFLKLTSVSGIGPRLAISILSGMPVSELIPSIRSNDINKLTAIPGVGRKTAERLVVELRDKLRALPSDQAAAGLAAGHDGRDVSSELLEDTVSALVSLGYARAVAERAAAAALRETGEPKIESLIRSALKKLSR